MVGKVLSVITMLWGVFFLIVLDQLLEMDLFDDDEIFTMAGEHNRIFCDYD